MNINPHFPIAFFFFFYFHVPPSQFVSIFTRNFSEIDTIIAATFDSIHFSVQLHNTQVAMSTEWIRFFAWLFWVFPLSIDVAAIKDDRAIYFCNLFGSMEISKRNRKSMRFRGIFSSLANDSFPTLFSLFLKLHWQNSTIYFKGEIFFPGFFFHLV